MTIVCATHFTDSSFNAVKVAGELARKHRQPLWLVNVLSPSSHGEDSGEREAAAVESLQLEVAALASAGLEVHSAVLAGALDRAVGHFCSDKGAQLLVVGDSSHKLNGLMAGTLDRFAYGIEIPVLVVRDPAPFSAWARGESSLRVLLALDHTWSSAVARDWIIRLAEYGPIDLVAAHVWWPTEEYERRGLVAPSSGNHDALAGLLRQETEVALQALPRNVKHRVHLEMGHGRVAQRLLDMATDEGVDVFVLGTHPHHGALTRIWSVSHDVLAEAPMSVAVVPGRVTLDAPSSSS